MSQAPRCALRSAIAINAPAVVEPFSPSAASRLLIDVRHTRHEQVEFQSNLFFNDLCGQIVREEAILLAGAPGSNKSTLARQLTLDLVSQGQRALMILTEESAERAKAGFVAMASEMPQSRVRAALSNIHVETGIHDVADAAELLCFAGSQSAWAVSRCLVDRAGFDPGAGIVR